MLLFDFYDCDGRSQLLFQVGGIDSMSALVESEGRTRQAVRVGCGTCKYNHYRTTAEATMALCASPDFIAFAAVNSVEKKAHAIKARLDTVVMPRRPVCPFGEAFTPP